MSLKSDVPGEWVQGLGLGPQVEEEGFGEYSLLMHGRNCEQIVFHIIQAFSRPLALWLYLDPAPTWQEVRVQMRAAAQTACGRTKFCRRAEEVLGIWGVEVLSFLGGSGSSIGGM